MQKIFFLAATICLQLNAVTSIVIDNRTIMATLDSDNSKTLYEILKIPPISIAFGHYKEFNIKGELYNLRDYGNDMIIECTAKEETTYECVIIFGLTTSWRTMLIHKNGYYNMVIKAHEVKKELKIVMPKTYMSSDKDVIIDCQSESTCFVAFSSLPSAQKKNTDKHCIIF